MKITDISVHIMGVTRPRPGGPAGRRNWTFVRIETDEGITGIGEATTEWYEHAVVAMIEKQFAPMLIGKDPTRINRAWQEMRRGIWWRDGVASTSAISGIDQALWDIAGKAAGLPVYKMLGGSVRDKVELYARPDLGTSTDVGELEAALEEGFRAYKHGVGPYNDPYDEQKQIGTTINLYKQFREAAGPDVKLMMDCLGNWTMQAAHKVIEGLIDQNILFFEEPVNVDTPRQLAELRRAFPGQRIAGGERLYTRWDVREWLEVGAVDVLQVDICHTGGISEMMRIASAAEVYNVPIAPHNPYGPVALAANIHACAAMQNFLILEHWRDHDLFDKVQVHGPTVQDGCAILDDKPGLGVELDWELIKEYPYCHLSQFHFNDRFGRHGLDMKPTMTRETMEPYDFSRMQFIKGVDHNESLSIGANGEAYTAGFITGRVFRLSLETNMGELVGENEGRPILGQVVDADGNIYCCEPGGPESKVMRITPKGEGSVYSKGPRGGSFMSCNTPAFDRSGNMYMSDTGSWSSAIDGHIYKIPPGGGDAELWFPQAVDTPNGIAIDGDEKYIYFVETWGNSIGRIAIKPDGSAGEFERVLHLPRHIPDGICFDEEGRIWIACDRPDIIYVFDVNSRRLEVFLEDWQGGGVRGACHLAFAGPQRDVLLASSVDRPRVHRYDNPGAKGLRLNNPKI